MKTHKKFFRPHLIASSRCFKLTCNLFNLASKSFDFGPGISVVMEGPLGSFDTYELKHLSSFAKKYVEF